MSRLSRTPLALLAGASALAAAALPALPAGAATPFTAAPAAGDLPLRYEIGAVITGGTLGTVSAMAMNEAGEVAGAANYPLDGFRWSEGDLDVLPDLPGHVDHVAQDLNDSGTVVGIAGRFGEDNYPRAVRWVDGVPEDLGVLEASGASEAYGVNDAGMVVGSASVGFGWRSFVWTEDDGMVQITNGIIGSAYDVNESGQVTGDSASTAYVWEDGELRFLEIAPGYDFSFGNAINEAGQVAGHLKVSGGTRTERFARWTPNGEVEVLGGAGSFNRSYGINNDGTTVGRGVIGAGYERGVIFHDDLGLRYIDDLLTTNEIRIHSGRDINDAGQILASGHNTYTGDGVTVRLDPISGPLMHEEDVVVKRSPDGRKAVGKLEVVNETGRPVRKARVEVAWYDGERVVEFDVADRTDNRGRVKFTRNARGMGGVTLCITEITHARYAYLPAGGGLPPCVQAT